MHIIYENRKKGWTDKRTIGVGSRVVSLLDPVLRLNKFPSSNPDFDPFLLSQTY